MDKVVHFEIPYDDKERAEGFYKNVFDWGINPVPEMEYSMAHSVEVDENQMPKESGAINGGMFQRKDDLNGVNIVINVESVDGALEKIKAAGGEIVREKRAVGDMGFVGYFKDTEGNVLGVWENVKKE